MTKFDEILIAFDQLSTYKELKELNEQLTAIIGAPFFPPAILERAEKTSFRIRAKMYWCAYKKSNFSHTRLAEILPLTESLAQEIVRKSPQHPSYEKSAEHVNKLKLAMEGYDLTITALREELTVCANDADYLGLQTHCERAKDEFAQINAQLDETARRYVGDDPLIAVDSISKEVGKRLETYATARYGHLYNDFCKENIFAKQKNYNYYPNDLRHPQYGTVKLAVVCSPFPEEITLLCEKHAQNKTLGSANCAIGDLNVLSRTDEGGIDYCLNRLFNEGNGYFLLTGISNVKKNADLLYGKITSFSRRSELTVLSDGTGNKTVFKKLTELSKAGNVDPMFYEYSANLYLRMPSLEEVEKELVKSFSAKDAELAEFKKYCVGLGYVDFNRILSLGASSKRWLEESILSARERQSALEMFLSVIPDIELLIPFDWGYQEKKETVSEKTRKAFDYDLPTSYDAKNLHIILEDERFSMTVRAGLAVKYCLTHGGDDTEVQLLDREEKTERAILACRVLASFLNLSVPPEAMKVAFDIKKEENCGGLCYNGGRLIRFMPEFLGERYHQLGSILCHELYHGFQHTVMEKWESWHLTEMQVSESRKRQWSNNSSNYYGELDKDFQKYYNQTIEADARIFADDATDGGETFWHRIKFNS